MFIVVYIYREEDILFCFCDNIFQWWLASLSLFDIISDVYLFFGEFYVCLPAYYRCIREDPDPLYAASLLLFVDQFSVSRRLVPISIEVGNYPPISPTHSLCALCTARLLGLHTAFL